MSWSSHLNTTPVRALRLISQFGAFAAFAAITIAQRAPQPVGEETVQLEAFTVTGSNVKRLESEKALPVTEFSLDEIDLRDASQASDLLAALPQVTGLPGNETATLGATARGDNATISLRGIPSSNTLILLNGRRPFSGMRSLTLC